MHKNHSKYPFTYFQSIRQSHVQTIVWRNLPKSLKLLIVVCRLPTEIFSGSFHVFHQFPTQRFVHIFSNNISVKENYVPKDKTIFVSNFSQWYIIYVSWFSNLCLNGQLLRSSQMAENRGSPGGTRGETQYPKKELGKQRSHNENGWYTNQANLCLLRDPYTMTPSCNTAPCLRKETFKMLQLFWVNAMTKSNTYVIQDKREISLIWWFPIICSDCQRPKFFLHQL